MTSVSEQPRIGGEGLFERQAAGASAGADSCHYHKFWKPGADRKPSCPGLSVTKFGSSTPRMTGSR
jgi:hypothetical protein